MATQAPITWDYRDPELWPSIARASALLLSLAALARLHEHVALTVDMVGLEALAPEHFAAAVVPTETTSSHVLS